MAIAVVVFAVAALRGELLGGEGDTAEHLAGILGAAGVGAAFLFGDSIVHHGYDQLYIPLQPDDGELAQSHIQSPVGAAHHQFFVEKLADSAGNADIDPIRLTALAAFPNLGTEDHGIEDFHH